jgi:CTP synthase (UTP-ammonia lyase)
VRSGTILAPEPGRAGPRQDLPRVHGDHRPGRGGRDGSASQEDRTAIAALACSLVGHEELVDLAPGTLAAAGSLLRTERYSCSFGPVPAYAPNMVAAGLVVSGRDEAGQPRVIELPSHPFFLATLFQPELAETQPHPLVASFVRAVQARAASR